MNVAQISILATRTTVQEASMIGTCLMNIREKKKPKNLQGKAATTAFNALQLLLWPFLCGEDL